jgi:hypothetical protein
MKGKAQRGSGNLSLTQENQLATFFKVTLIHENMKAVSK